MEIWGYYDTKTNQWVLTSKQLNLVEPNIRLNIEPQYSSQYWTRYWTPILIPIWNPNIGTNIEPNIGLNIEPDVETRSWTQYWTKYWTQYCLPPLNLHTVAVCVAMRNFFFCKLRSICKFWIQNHFCAILGG